jgi:hypothetical protein
VLLCLLITALALTTLGASRHQTSNDTTTTTAARPELDSTVRGQAAGRPIGLTLLRNAPTTTTTAPPTTTTQAPPPPAPKPAPAAPRPGIDVNNPATWDRLARCEAGGNWAANTGNGYFGGLQFSLSSWRGVGGSGYPHEASRETQIEMGKRLQRSSGWGAWPACSRKLGYR